jgi:hypothetical protein
MKRLYFAVVLMVVSTAAFCQMFDGTIDGAIPGTMEDVSAHFIKKGYKFINCPTCTPDVVFMEGGLVLNHPKNKKADVLVYMEKKDNFVNSISLYYPSEHKFQWQYDIHKRIFINSFGNPTIENKTQCKWVFLMYTYTIGAENNRIYHKLEINKQ